jgi:hypothetical protein
MKEDEEQDVLPCTYYAFFLPFCLAGVADFFAPPPNQLYARWEPVRQRVLVLVACAGLLPAVTQTMYLPTINEVIPTALLCPTSGKVC